MKEDIKGIIHKTNEWKTNKYSMRQVHKLVMGYCLTTWGKPFTFTSSIEGGFLTSVSGTNSDNLDIQNGDKG